MRLFLLLAIVIATDAPAQTPLPLETAPAAAAAAMVPLAAVSPTNPYEAVVPLADTSPATEAVALREALTLVIAGVTGLPDVRTNVGALGILDQASQLAQHYGDEKDPSTQALVLRAAFDPTGLEAALKRAGLPVFGMVAGAEQEWPVDVRAVNNFHDYGRAVYALRKLRGVKGVQVQTVDGDRLQLVVRFEGDAQTLSRAIAATGIFTPALAGAAQGCASAAGAGCAGAAGAALQFSLQPG